MKKQIETFGITRLVGESWRECVARYGRKIDSVEEMLEIFDREAQTIKPEWAALKACWEYLACEKTSLSCISQKEGQGRKGDSFWVDDTPLIQPFDPWTYGIVDEAQGGIIGYANDDQLAQAIVEMLMNNVEDKSSDLL